MRIFEILLLIICEFLPFNSIKSHSFKTEIHYNRHGLYLTAPSVSGRLSLANDTSLHEYSNFNMMFI